MRERARRIHTQKKSREQKKKLFEDVEENNIQKKNGQKKNTRRRRERIYTFAILLLFKFKVELDWLLAS